MFKKLILILVAFFFLSRFNFALASGVIINEFVSNPGSGSEWIELLNTSSSSVDLSSWSWTELASPGGDAEHESSPKSLSGVIPSGGVFVFEMSNALNNTGDSIGLYKGTNLEDRVTYGKVNNYSKDLDAPTKDKSGARINGSWLTNQEPTKGVQNPSLASSTEEESNGGTNSTSASSENTINTETKNVATQKIKVQIIGKTLAFVGIPFTLEGRVYGNQGERLYSGRDYWNFGDGDSREAMANNIDKFEHVYFYPGDYTILLEHYPDFFADIPDATEELVVKIVVPEISISSVGDEKDFFVELTNNSDYDADLSGWFLLGGQKSFLIPHGTILTTNDKMIISSRVSQFSIEDKNNLKLMNSEGDLIFAYLSSPVPKYKVAKASTQTVPDQGSKNVLIDGADLSASVAESDILDGKGKSSLPIIPIASFVFIGASAGVVYFIRRKKVVPEVGGDFEILDE